MWYWLLGSAEQLAQSTGNPTCFARMLRVGERRKLSHPWLKQAGAKQVLKHHFRVVFKDEAMRVSCMVCQHPTAGSEFEFC